MRLIAAGLMAALLTAATPAAPDLQARMDHVLEVNRVGMPVKAVLSGGQEFEVSDHPGRVAIPEAALRLAPSDQAVDGLLAMLASFATVEQKHRSDRASLGEIAAVAGLSAAMGGANDGKGGKTFIPSTSNNNLDSNFAAVTQRDLALRGLRWSKSAGVCQQELIAYLRKLSREQTGSSTPKALLRAAGMEAFSGGC